MGGITPVAQFWQSFYPYMTGTQYPLQIDANSAVMQRLAASFAPSPLPDAGGMQVCVDPGHLSNGPNLVEVGCWAVGTIASGSNQLTLSQAVSGFAAGMLIIGGATTPGGSGVIGSGSGIPDGTTISSASGFTITMSQNATLGGTVYVKICQVTGAVTAPASGFTRTDRVCINALTGILQYVVGTPVNTGTASPPAIPAGYLPCCQVFLTSSTTVLNSTQIMDERDFCNLGTGFTAYGQCQLQYSSATTIVLMPFKGNKVTFPSGLTALIGSSGISAVYNNCSINGTAAQTLSASTHYYAYLWWNGSNFVIDFSTTGYAVDANTGINVKSGDSTRVLVGQVYTAITTGQFQSSATQLMVRSWFNDPGTFGNGNFTTNRTYGTNAYAEINSEIRVNFLPWAGETVELDFRAFASAATSGNNISNAIGIDSTSVTTGNAANAISTGVNFVTNLSQIYRTTALSEGNHFVTLLGDSNNSVTITWYSAYTTLNVKCCGSPA